MNPRVTNFILASAAFFAAAMMTPWWGTGVVATVFAFMRSSSARLVGFSSFFGWTLAIFARDALNQQGPSRTLVRLVHESGAEPSLTRLILILGTALLVALFSGLCAGFITAAKKSWISS